MPTVIRRNQDAHAKIIAREPFRNPGRSLSAHWVQGSLDVGRGKAPEEVREAIHALPRDERIYVVYSYSTPIAWAVEGQHLLTVPVVRYSTTTTEHQHEVMGGRGLTKDGRVDYNSPYVVTGTSLAVGDAGVVRKGLGKSPFGPRAGSW